MAVRIPERFLWAASVVKVQPGDRMLEIGCGTGILAELLSNMLTNGYLIALDKSLPMVAKARKRNHHPFQRSRVRIEYSIFLEFRHPEKFDKIVAFNVNIFRPGHAEDLLHLRQMLSDKGQLYIFYQTPSGIDANFMDSIAGYLAENSFRIDKILLEATHTIAAGCIIAG